MERIHARALETENRVRMLETHGLRLQAQQTMLTTISTQAVWRKSRSTCCTARDLVNAYAAARVRNV